MTDNQAGEREESADEMVPALRAIEWELREVIRRLEVLGEQIRGLAERDSDRHS